MVVGERDLRHILDQLVRDNPKNAAVWLQRGLLEVHEERPAEGTPFIEQAYRLAPHDSDVMAGRAWQAAESGNLELASEAWAELLQSHQLTGEWQYKFGKFLYQSGRKEEARRYLELAARPRRLESDGWQFWWTERAGSFLHHFYGAPMPSY